MNCWKILTIELWNSPTLHLQPHFILYTLWNVTVTKSILSGMHQFWNKWNTFIIQVFQVGEVGRAVKMALRTRFGFAAVNHLYSEEEKQILHGYQSLEYLPPHSKAQYPIFTLLSINYCEISSFSARFVCLLMHWFKLNPHHILRLPSEWNGNRKGKMRAPLLRMRLQDHGIPRD